MEGEKLSLLEVLQLLGAAVTVAGVFLAIYVVVGRLLLIVKPSWGSRFVQFLAEVHVDIVNHFGAALGEAAIFIVAGVIVVVVTGRMAVRRGLL